MSNTILAVRVTLEIRKLLDRVCSARGEDLSDFIRRSILKELASLSFLSDDTKKALGVQVEKNRRVKKAPARPHERMDRNLVNIKTACMHACLIFWDETEAKS